MKSSVGHNQIENRISQRNPVSEILILGYGNPLRGDDALGPVMSERLARRFAADPRVTVQSIPQLTLDLAETLANFRQVILIDAQNAAPAGELFSRQIQPSQKLPPPFSHYLSPEELLGVCQILYAACPEMILIGLNAAQFETGAPISPALLDNMDALAAQIEKIVCEDQP